MAEEKNIAFLQDGEASLLADRTLFKRILNNLLANSLKYTNENGRIDIRVQRTSHGLLKLTIQDNGIGIPAEHLPYLFDRFYRVDPSRSSQSGGLGLGLSIVKSIVLLNGGNIDIQSQVNLDTEVNIVLPC